MWWKKQLKSEASWELEENLRADGAGLLLDRYNEDMAPKTVKVAKKVTPKKVAKKVTAKTTKKIFAKKKK